MMNPLKPMRDPASKISQIRKSTQEVPAHSDRQCTQLQPHAQSDGPRLTGFAVQRVRSAPFPGLPEKRDGRKSRWRKSRKWWVRVVKSVGPYPNPDEKVLERTTQDPRHRIQGRQRMGGWVYMAQNGINTEHAGECRSVQYIDSA